MAIDRCVCGVPYNGSPHAADCPAVAAVRAQDAEHPEEGWGLREDSWEVSDEALAAMDREAEASRVVSVRRQRE